MDKITANEAEPISCSNCEQSFIPSKIEIKKIIITLVSVFALMAISFPIVGGALFVYGQSTIIFIILGLCIIFSLVYFSLKLSRSLVAVNDKEIKI